jgi:hypothetical protein
MRRQAISLREPIASGRKNIAPLKSFRSRGGSSGGRHAMRSTSGVLCNSEDAGDLPGDLRDRRCATFFVFMTAGLHGSLRETASLRVRLTAPFGTWRPASAGPSSNLFLPLWQDRLGRRRLSLFRILGAYVPGLPEGHEGELVAVAVQDQFKMTDMATIHSASARKVSRVLNRQLARRTGPCHEGPVPAACSTARLFLD